jgi:hypothetical protein
MIASATDAGAVCLSTKVLVVPPSVYVVVIPPVTAVEMSPAVLNTLVTPPMTVVTMVPPDMAYLVTRGAKDAVVDVSYEVDAAKSKVGWELVSAVIDEVSSGPIRAEEELGCDESVAAVEPLFGEDPVLVSGRPDRDSSLNGAGKLVCCGWL